MIPLTLNLLQGSVTFRFSPSAALDLQREINILLDRLKAIATSGKAYIVILSSLFSGHQLQLLA